MYARVLRKWSPYAKLMSSMRRLAMLTMMLLLIVCAPIPIVTLNTNTTPLSTTTTTIIQTSSATGTTTATTGTITTTIANRNYTASANTTATTAASSQIPHKNFDIVEESYFIPVEVETDVETEIEVEAGVANDDDTLPMLRSDSTSASSAVHPHPQDAFDEDDAEEDEEVASNFYTNRLINTLRQNTSSGSNYNNINNNNDNNSSSNSYNNNNDNNSSEKLTHSPSGSSSSINKFSSSNHQQHRPVTLDANNLAYAFYVGANVRTANPLKINDQTTFARRRATTRTTNSAVFQLKQKHIQHVATQMHDIHEAAAAEQQHPEIPNLRRSPQLKWHDHHDADIAADRVQDHQDDADDDDDDDDDREMQNDDPIVVGYDDYNDDDKENSNNNDNEENDHVSRERHHIERNEENDAATLSAVNTQQIPNSHLSKLLSTTTTSRTILTSNTKHQNRNKKKKMNGMKLRRHIQNDDDNNNNHADDEMATVQATEAVQEIERSAAGDANGNASVPYALTGRSRRSDALPRMFGMIQQQQQQQQQQEQTFDTQNNNNNNKNNNNNNNDYYYTKQFSTSQMHHQTRQHQHQHHHNYKNNNNNNQNHQQQHQQQRSTHHQRQRQRQRQRLGSGGGGSGSSSSSGTTYSSSSTSSLSGGGNRHSRRYCSARDPAQLAFEAPTVFEGKVISMTSDRRSNFSATVEVRHVFKQQIGVYRLQKLIRLNFAYHNGSGECDIYREQLRPQGLVRDNELELGRIYLLFVQQMDSSNFTILGQPIRKTKHVVDAVQRAVSGNYAKPAKIKNITPSRTTGEVGKELRIVCKVEGNPPPKVTWFKDLKSINRNRNRKLYQFVHYKKRSELIIRSFKVSDAGRYECRAKNKVNRDIQRNSTVIKAPNPEPRFETHSTSGTGNICPDDASEFCFNGGTCKFFSEIGSYSCVCPEGFVGERCDRKEVNNMPPNSTFKTGYIADDPDAYPVRGNASGRPLSVIV